MSVVSGESFRSWLSNALGVTPQARVDLLWLMMERQQRASFTYWFQLGLAMAIATLGLVLGSTGVVIGAMLISPLMEPIIEASMGLAVGSPYLAMRSFIRIGGSIVMVVVCAAVITVALPFREVTPEIAARTTPTVLDLLVALCCALMAAFTTARATTESAVAASGTAIGISLVPPLCVVGFGLGALSPSTAAGAALLFTANLSSILLFATLFFLACGMDRVDVDALESNALAGPHAGERMARAAQALRNVFGSRYGRPMRWLMPAVLVAAIYVPLSQALAEVTWQVSTRNRVTRLLAEEELTRDPVRQSITVERGTVAVRLVVLGNSDDAARVETELRQRIADAAGVEPVVSLVAVPDIGTVRATASTLIPKLPAPAPPIPEPPALPAAESAVHGALTAVWPRVAGEMLRWRLEHREGAPPLLEVLHAGPALSSAGEHLLARALTERLRASVQVRTVNFSVEPVTAPPEQAISWLPALTRMVESALDLEVAHVCVEAPPARAARGVPDALKAVTELQGRLAARMNVAAGPQWLARLSLAPCVAETQLATTPGTDALPPAKPSTAP
ncbi:MAG: DUF389 domain-containing protein [Myxococcota bacterium]